MDPHTAKAADGEPHACAEPPAPAVPPAPPDPPLPFPPIPPLPAGCSTFAQLLSNKASTKAHAAWRFKIFIRFRSATLRRADQLKDERESQACQAAHRTLWDRANLPTLKWCEAEPFRTPTFQSDPPTLKWCGGAREAATRRREAAGAQSFPRANSNRVLVRHPLHPVRRKRATPLCDPGTSSCPSVIGSLSLGALAPFGSHLCSSV